MNMGYSCKVAADSIGPSGVRLTTLEVTYPLIGTHWDHLRHRVFSFSVASNRAIPTREYIRRVIEDPACPYQWGKNQPGMVAREELTGWRRAIVSRVWLACRWLVIPIAWLCWKLGAHKEIVNWLLSPWAWTTLLVTGTDWTNFFALRRHADARPEIRHAADMMFEARSCSRPRHLAAGEWHLPLCDNDFIPDPRDWDTLCLVSAARCARVSLLKHGETRSVKDEIAKAETLMKAGHMSPFEHQAQALPDARRAGNLRGWASFRSTIPNEDDFGKIGGAK